MRIAEADILIVPGLGGSGPDHWQTRWESKLSTARRIEQADWDRPILADWTARIAKGEKMGSSVAYMTNAVPYMHSTWITSMKASGHWTKEDVA